MPLAIILSIASLIFIWFMLKGLSKKEIYVTWWTVSSLAVFMDLLLGVAPLDLFDFAERPKPELKSIVIEIIMPAAFGIIYLNFMPLKKSLRLILYTAAYILLSVFLEWLLVLTGYLTYKGWTLWLSAIVYILGTIFLRWHLFFIRKPD